MKLRAFSAALLAFSLCASPALAAWSITALSANGNAQNSGGSSMTTGSVTIPANALGFAGGNFRRTNAAHTATVSDSAGNSWTVIECTAVNGTASEVTFIAYFRYGGTGLTAGTITATGSAAWTGAAMSSGYATGGQLTPIEDSAGRGCPGTPNATSTSPSVTSGTPSASGNLAIGVTARFGTSSGFSYTADTTNGWTQVSAQGNGNVVEGVGYAVNSGSSAIVNNPTMNNALWTQQIAQFFVDPPASSGTGRRGALLGVGQ